MSKLCQIENANKGFISIKTNKPKETLKQIQSKLKVDVFDISDNEILLNIPKGGCGFSLDQLKQTAKDAIVDCFNLILEDDGSYYRYWYCSNKKERILSTDSKLDKDLTVREYNKQVRSKNNNDIQEVNDNLQHYFNPDFGRINVLMIDDEPWFIGKEIAEILGYSKSRNAILQHVDKEDKNTALIRGGNKKGNPNKVVINESGLYSLILSSKLPSAKKFKHWVTSEVLPSIRKHGAYMTPETLQQAILNPDFLIQLATELKTEQNRNRELTATNIALTKDANTWDEKSVINALIRKYASLIYKNNFALAWNTYYKRLNYKQHINLRIRRSLSDNSKTRLIDLIEPSEIKTALKLAVAMCEEKGINTGEIINSVNMSTYVD